MNVLPALANFQAILCRAAGGLFLPGRLAFSIQEFGHGTYYTNSHRSRRSDIR
ncbi:hypothetical protein CPJ18_11460 [Agrobacterium rosae]|uniref:Uncharacterized protein n=1 Tax=Agrobacterium rosae TaxID=1972867 RepID=A0AAE5RY93_9HYPH|nr:hypothetical protein CPJ18_11460 [Agrobacterium rosae]POO57083.1 hypothetical protein CTT39_07735 [Agrobacterium rosae]